MDTRQLQEGRHGQASDQDRTKQGGKRMYNRIIRPLTVAALLVGLAASGGPQAQAVPASTGADIPEVVDCSLFGQFYDEEGRQLRDTHGLSWEAQLCATAEYGAQLRIARSGRHSERYAQTSGLNCTMVAQFYDKRGTILPGLQLLPWETQPCASIQRSRYLQSSSR